MKRNVLNTLRSLPATLLSGLLLFAVFTSPCFSLIVRDNAEQSKAAITNAVEELPAIVFEVVEDSDDDSDGDVDFEFSANSQASLLSIESSVTELAGRTLVTSSTHFKSNLDPPALS